MLQENDSSLLTKREVSAQDHGFFNDDVHEKKVNLPSDLGIIRNRAELPHDKSGQGAFTSVTGFWNHVQNVSNYE